MNRITVELAIEAYRSTGRIPTQRITDDGIRACGLGVMYAHDFHGTCELDAKYAGGFVYGFDSGIPSMELMCTYPAQTRQGIEDGAALWEVVKDSVTEVPASQVPDYPPKWWAKVLAKSIA